MKILLRVGIFCLGFLLLLQIWVTHSLISQGANLKKMGDLQNSLTEENLMLENAIASASAYLSIASRSAELGFSVPKAVQYIH